MIDVGDGRGLANKAEAAKNRENVIQFFQRNPGATKIQCAASLGLSQMTVSRHVKSIMSEEKK